MACRPAGESAVHIKRRKQIWEALHPTEAGGRSLPTCLSDGRKAGPQHERRFAADTAAVSDESKRSINQHLARAESLGDDLPRVAGTSLDKGVELDALAKMPEPERKGLIDRADAGEVVSARRIPDACAVSVHIFVCSLVPCLNAASRCAYELNVSQARAPAFMTDTSGNDAGRGYLAKHPIPLAIGIGAEHGESQATSGIIALGDFNLF